MVALALPAAVAVRLALDIPGAEPVSELHLTLAFLGAADQRDSWDDLRLVASAFASSTAPIAGEISGVGRFSAPAGSPDPFYASVDASALPSFRQALVGSLKSVGLPVAENHGYTPHVTLAYLDKQTGQGPGRDFRSRLPLAVTFDRMLVAVGPEKFYLPLAGAVATVTRAAEEDERDRKVDAFAALLLSLVAQLRAGDINEDDLEGQVADAFNEALGEVPPEAVDRVTILRDQALDRAREYVAAVEAEAEAEPSDEQKGAWARHVAGSLWGAALAAAAFYDPERLLMWRANDDPRTCPDCDALDGQTFFPSEVVWWPGESDFGEYTECGPECRCTLEAAEEKE
jgi:2'-5' RNA ligase